ncbi:hypothetical protein [Streptomyces vilmorinianum]|uniref:hypothetical protein n=1 Tax=Streptomyces vilmorinianum TaxID=3051092 RepID=UPI0015861339|nr:hypothetical protein [Streptomyces vilmorinianum]
MGGPVPAPRCERVDWDRVRRETEESPMAAAFLYLLELLDVIERRDGGGQDDA